MSIWTIVVGSLMPRSRQQSLCHFWICFKRLLTQRPLTSVLGFCSCLNKDILSGLSFPSSRGRRHVEDTLDLVHLETMSR